MLRNFLSRYRNIFLILLSSILVFISYPKISLSSLAFISLVPAILAIFNTDSDKKAVFYGYLFGFFTYLFIYYWIYVTLRAGGVNFSISVLGLILLCLLTGLEYIPVFWIAFRAKNYGKMKLFLFVFPSVWVLISFLRVFITKYLPYFPWFQISYSQYNNIYLLNLADYSYLIDFIIVFVNTLLASIIIEKDRKSRVRKFLYAVIVVFIAHLWGYFKYTSEKEKIENSEKKIKISIIQPSIDFYKKWNREYVDYIKSRIENLINTLKIQKPDIIIWPENALYGWIDDSDVFNWMCSQIKKTDSYHIVGSVSRGDGKYVSAFLIDNNCNILEEYHKRKLVPFGEYVPFRKILGNYIDVITSLGEFEPGSFNQKPFKFKDYIIGPSICYETIFDYLYLSMREVDLWFNITNDGWYLDSSAPYQHFAAAVIRSVETRRPFIRAANNGISAFINPDGTVTKKLKLNEYGVITSEVKVIEVVEKSDIERFFTVYLSLMVLVAFALASIFR